MLCSVEEYCKVSRILEIGSRSNLKGRERCPNDQIISYSCVQTFLKQKVYINLLFQMTYPTVYSGFPAKHSNVLLIFCSNFCKILLIHNSKNLTVITDWTQLFLEKNLLRSG